MCKSLELINQGGEIRVSSRVIAKNFEKEHTKVLRSIRNLIVGVSKSGDTQEMFVQHQHINEQNGESYAEFLLNRDGFTLLAMGFTGEKALEWKLKYIEAFNNMEKALKEPKQLTAIEQLELHYQAIRGNTDKLKEVEDKVTNLEDTMTIDYEQQLDIFNCAKSTVLDVVGGKGSLAYKEMYRKVIAAIWRDYKDYFAVNSYKNTARKDFTKAKDYLISWKSEGSLLRELETYTNQIKLDI